MEERRVERSGKTFSVFDSALGAKIVLDRSFAPCAWEVSIGYVCRGCGKLPHTPILTYLVFN